MTKCGYFLCLFFYKNLICFLYNSTNIYYVIKRCDDLKKRMNTFKTTISQKIKKINRLVMAMLENVISFTWFSTIIETTQSASTSICRYSGSGTEFRTLSTTSANFISPLVICNLIGYQRLWLTFSSYYLILSKSLLIEIYYGKTYSLGE